MPPWISPVSYTHLYPKRIAVKDIAVLVGADVQLLDEQFPIIDAAPAVLHIDGAGPQALYLGAIQLNSRLVGFLHKVPVSYTHLDVYKRQTEILLILPP